MKKYVKIHEEGSVTPLTLSTNHYGMVDPILRDALDGRTVGAHPFCAYAGRFMEFYVDGDKWNECSRYIVEQVGKNKKLVTEIDAKSHTIGMDIIDFLHVDGRVPMPSLSAEAVARQSVDIFKKSVRLCAYGYVAALSDFNTFYFSKEINAAILKHEGICKRHGSSVSGVLSLLTSPAEPLPSDRAKRELLKSGHQKGAQRIHGLEAWLQKWSWISHGHLGPGTNLADARSLLRSLNRRKSDLQRTFIRKEQERWYQRLGLSPRDERLLRAGERFVYLKAYRQEILFGVYAYLQRLITHTARQCGIPKAHVEHMSIWEISDALRNKSYPEPSELARRKEYMVWIAGAPWKSRIISGRKAHSYVAAHGAPEEVAADVSVLRGQVAYPGRARGPVMVVNAPEDMRKIGGPFILVSHQTNPELLPVMKKAKAFVTDHGGITSHASIVARELKTPCVIGTRMATKLLKDGDMVEVDAERGIVTKL